MKMVTSTSALDNNLSQTSSFGNQNNLHDASFASYLNHTDENFFLLKLTGSTQNRTSLVSAPEEHLYLEAKKVEDEEIGIFDAEKYFKGAMDVENPRISSRGNRQYDHEKDNSLYTSLDKPKTQPATPSAHSESSWNSQNLLLYSVRRNQTQRKPKKGFLAKIGCKCYCSDKNSVEVDTGNIGDNSEGVLGKGISNQPMKTGDLVTPRKSLSKTQAEEKILEMGIGSKGQERFSFPVLKAEDTSVRVKLNEGDDTTRNSLEVFGSPILEKGDKTFSLERKLTMLNWGPAVSQRVEGIQIPSNGTNNDDMESDASSDLFEIESLSTNPNHYAPSEASIEWSVVTASAADFSTMSDFEDPRMERSQRQGKEMQKQHLPGILLGCKSQKSVRIAGDRTKEKSSQDQRGSHKSESSKSSTMFQPEKRLMGFDSRNGQRGFRSLSLSSPHSAHAPHLLYK